MTRAETPPPSTAPLALVVEDEPVLAELLADTLRDAGFRIEVLERGDAVAAAVRARSPAVVLLDLVLPGRDGFAVCREVRAFSTVPLIMITGRAEEADRLRGLEIGADDYILKPFATAEVVARVRALLRRTRDWRDGEPSASGLTLDIEAMRALWHGSELELTPVEFRLLAILGRRPGRVFSRAELLDALYVDDHAVSDRAIDSHIKNLRRKLADVHAEASPIESVYGIGYRFRA